MSTRSRASAPFDLTQLLDCLEGVDYIVVGGVAGTLHGTPRLTFGLDIVPDTPKRSIDRLAAALVRLGATIREPGDRGLEVTKQLLTERASAVGAGQLRLRSALVPWMFSGDSTTAAATGN